MKRFRYILVFIMCILTTSTAMAFGYRGLFYAINEDDTTTVRVVEYKTTVSYGDEFEGTTTYNYRHLYGKDVNVPSKVSYNGATYRVTKIDDKALYGAGIKSITLSNGLEEIGNGAFSYNPNVEYYMFVYESFQNNIESITLPVSLKYIGKDAFTGCNLKKVVIPSIDWWCGVECVSTLASGYDLYVGDKLVEDLVIPDGVESIRDNCFAGCANTIESIDIPNSIKSIGTSAFANLGIKNVSIHSLESWCGIDFKSALASSFDLYLNGELIEDLVVPEGIEAIKDYCFSSCKIKSINLPNTLKTIGTSAFASYGIEKVIIHSLESWCELNYNALLSSKYDLYLGEDLVEDLVIPEGVKTIRDYCFAGCQNLKSIDVPTSLTKVGLKAFTEHDLKKIIIHSLDSWLNIDFKSSVASPYEFYLDDLIVNELSITSDIDSIKSNAFCYNYSLTDVSLGNSIKYVGSKAFYCCKNINELILPNSLNQIGDHAFYGMSSMRSVVSYIEKPENVVLGTSVFKSPNSYINSILYVPKGTIDKYKNCAQWKKFVTIREMAQSDVNGDYVANVRDVTAIINAVLNGVDETIISHMGYNLYDVNHDGFVDVKDVTFAINEALN